MSSSGPCHPSLTRQEKRDKHLAAIIAKQVAKAVSDVYENANKSSEESRAEAPKATAKAPFCFKQFKSCGPKEFTGEEGPTAGCPDDLRTLNATDVFQSRALDWWTAKRNKQGNDAAYGLSWDELKEVMLEEFCSPHERQKLEDEFWHIQQKDGDNAALTARFKQLSIICPNQVKTPEMAIKNYIRALPDCVADFVHASKPATIEATYLLAAEINDKRVKAGYWDKPSKSQHQATVSPSTESTAPSKKKNKRKNRPSSKNFVITTAPQQAIPAQAMPVASAPPATRAYTGTHPVCPTRTYHHPVDISCRYCAHCKVYKHFTAHCRYGPRQAPVQVVAQ
ncbi:putative retrotransposon gag domain-containing protein [Helianthus anomalus]